MLLVASPVVRGPRSVLVLTHNTVLFVRALHAIGMLRSCELAMVVRLRWRHSVVLLLVIAIIFVPVAAITHWGEGTIWDIEVLLRLLRHHHVVVAHHCVFERISSWPIIAVAIVKLLWVVPVASAVVSLHVVAHLVLLPVVWTPTAALWLLLITHVLVVGWPHLLLIVTAHLALIEVLVAATVPVLLSVLSHFERKVKVLGVLLSLKVSIHAILWLMRSKLHPILLRLLHHRQIYVRMETLVVVKGALAGTHRITATVGMRRVSISTDV